MICLIAIAKTAAFREAKRIEGFRICSAGALTALGLLTRLAAIPLIVDMLVAIITTKIPILMKSGFWAMAHEARVDYAMLLGCLFLLIVGAGPISIDARLTSESSI